MSLASFRLIKRLPCIGAHGEEDGASVAVPFRLVRPLFRVEDFDFVGDFLHDAVEFARLREARKFSETLRLGLAECQLIALSSSLYRS